MITWWTQSWTDSPAEQEGDVAFWKQLAHDNFDAYKRLEAEIDSDGESWKRGNAEGDPG